MEELQSVIRGNVSEYRLMARLIELGFPVYKSCTEFSRCDFIVDTTNGLKKVQCKTARIRDGVVRVLSRSVNNLTYESKDYKNDVDYIGAYCHDNNKCYMIPIDICGKCETWLRIEETLSGQQKKIKWAKDYEI